MIRENRKITLTQLRKSWPTKVSKSTIRRVIHSVGLKNCIPRKNPYLQARHIKKRLDWAIQRKYWGIEEWNRVIWTDESSVEIGKNSHQVRIWRYTGEEWDLSCVLPTFKSGRTSVMVWGCFAGTSMGPLVVIPRDRRTGLEYRDIILAGPLHDFYLSTKDIEGEVFLMEDGAPTHRSKAANDWRRENSIKCLEWPAQSPDLNPIENIWHTLKEKINNRPSIPKDETELVAALKEEWLLIPSDNLRRLAESMPKRIKELIKNKGGHIHY